MGRIKSATKKEIPKKICIKCQKSRDLVNGYYGSPSDLFPDKKYPVCKTCLVSKLPPSNPDDINYVEAVKNVLAEMNKPWVGSLWTISVEEATRVGKDIFGMYMKNLALNTRDLTSKDGDGGSKKKTQPSSLDTSSSAKHEQEIIDEETVEFTEDDIRAHKDCIRLIGYDPFLGYTKFDQKFLYGEFIPYLDEDTLEDQYKISVIVQLLNNNNQIRKIDLLINKLSSNHETLLSNAADIKNLTTTKSTIATSNDKLAKENAIAIKHRGDKKAGRSTLGYLMKDLRELGFENAEEDYYDMKRAYGMQMTADISHKSILSQLNFDEKDFEDMFKEQRDLIITLQNQKDELEEKLRVASLKIVQLKKSGDSE